MKNGAKLLIVVMACAILILICGCQMKSANNFDCPDEVYSTIVLYNDNFGSGQAAEIVYFPNEEAKLAYQQSSYQMKEYKIKSIEKVADRDNLYKVIVLIRTTWHEKHLSLTDGEYVAYTIYVGRIQEQWKIIRNEDDLYIAESNNLL